VKTKTEVSGNTTRTPATERVARMAGNHSTALLTEVAKGRLGPGSPKNRMLPRARYQSARPNPLDLGPLPVERAWHEDMDAETPTFPLLALSGGRLFRIGSVNWRSAQLVLGHKAGTKNGSG